MWAQKSSFQIFSDKWNEISTFSFHVSEKIRIIGTLWYATLSRIYSGFTNGQKYSQMATRFFNQKIQKIVEIPFSAIENSWESIMKDYVPALPDTCLRQSKSLEWIMKDYVQVYGDPYFRQWKLLRVTNERLCSGLTMKKSKMKRCAASCDGQDCKAER
jgi:hypothetical protein